MTAKSNRTRPWYAPFYARMHEGIQEIGFIPHGEFESVPEIIPPPDESSLLNPSEYKSYRSFRPKLYRGLTKNGMMKYVLLGGQTSNRGPDFIVLTNITCPPVVKLLALLQRAESLEELLAFQMYNPCLSLEYSTKLHRGEDLIARANNVLVAVKDNGLAWLDQEFPDLSSLIDRGSPPANQSPLAIACRLYMQEYDTALEKLLKLESDFESEISCAMDLYPRLSKQEAEDLVVKLAYNQRPNQSYKDRVLIAMVRQACEARSLEPIIQGRSIAFE